MKMNAFLALVFVLILARSAYCQTCAGQGSCDAEWVYYCDRCYLFSDDQVNRSLAQIECQQLDSILADVLSQEENDFIKNNIKGESWLGLITASPGDDRGCGGEASCNRENWTWQSSEAVVYVNWVSTEPTGDSECARMKTNGLWADIKCGRGFNYVCQKPSVSLITAAHTTESLTSSSTPLPTTTSLATQVTSSSSPSSSSSSSFPPEATTITTVKSPESTVSLLLTSTMASSISDDSTVSPNDREKLIYVIVGGVAAFVLIMIIITVVLVVKYKREKSDKKQAWSPQDEEGVNNSVLVDEPEDKPIPYRTSEGPNPTVLNYDQQAEAPVTSDGADYDVIRDDAVTAQADSLNTSVDFNDAPSMTESQYHDHAEFPDPTYDNVNEVNIVQTDVTSSFADKTEEKTDDVNKEDVNALYAVPIKKSARVSTDCETVDNDLYNM